ncbi:unnamed protein product [Rotaria magnacalcarata]|uniref:CCHC-type domain-containing protein n=2 Tax=Rotaria magnacalcarata TaxID=392030 RepID=A0A816WM75_9BILA|nr:unnamed protein product [Rotaria magnacalcarata]
MVHSKNQQNSYSIDKLLDRPLPNCLSHQCPCSIVHDDSHTNIRFVKRTNDRHHLHHAQTTTTDIIPLNSPARSKRGSPSSDPDEDDFQIISHQKKKKQVVIHNRQQHQHHNSPGKTNSTLANPVRSTVTRSTTNINANNNIVQHDTQVHQNITTAATRYATSRFPFPPFITRFNSNKVSLKIFKEEMVNHFKINHQIEINILNCRSSNVNCTNNDIDILLYLKDSASFASLYDKNIWPLSIAGENYLFPSWPTIPPQLSLIMKNVNIRIDFIEFNNEVKSLVPEVKNVIRMKNKFGNDIHMVKLELTSPTARQKLLDTKKLTVNYISYEITEFLAPVNVLVCSKCSGIGHFRKQCTEQLETCKNCSQAFPDIKSHRCTAEPKCKHCNGDHPSNSIKCPVIKSYRAELTKKLLNTNNRSTLSSTTINDVNKYVYDPSNFPPLPVPHASFNGPVLSKLDDLIGKIAQVSQQLSNVAAKQEKFEHFMVESANHNVRSTQQIDVLTKREQELNADLIQHNLFIERHENLFKKLLIPMFEDLFGLIAAQNQDKKGNTLDADLKCNLERYLVQLKKTREGKHCLN